MDNLRVVEIRNCSHCKSQFLPNKGGYNARYCSETCRNRARKLRLGSEKLGIQRKRRYMRIKLSSDRYSRHLNQAKTSAQKVRTWLASYKLDRGCIDCGFKEHFAALQLDHTGPKSIEIADARSSIDRLQLEIASGKCVVRCANCHSIKTWNDKQIPWKQYLGLSEKDEYGE